MTTLHLPGQKVEVTADDRKDWQDLSGLGLTVDVLQRQDVIGVVRGEPLERAKLEGAEESDVVELQFDGGVRQYLSVAQLRDESTSQRGAADENVVEIPAVFSRGTGRATRGTFDWVLRGLRVLRIRPDAAIADLGETAVIERFENGLAPPPGLYRIDSGGKLTPNAANLDIAAPWLLFIHGTASSTNGSFGDLFGTHEWSLLRKFYDDRILAFQHKTLSVSPIDNALELAALLPARARLHLVTHSRGGLIGELLGIDSFDETKALRAFERRHRAEEAAKLVRLRDLLKTKQFAIEKFVRVAAPARGTILASKRLDIYLSVVLNVIGALPLLANDPLYAVLKASALELIRRRTTPDHLPGLEAMMPESPLIHFLNQGQGLSSASDLAVIAGDLQGEGFWGRLKAFVTDAFYLEEHDLVVNTAAMFGGVGRTKTASGVYDRGGSVNHFSYFSNERTRARLHAWLTSAPNAGFEPFDPGKTGINIPPMRAGADPKRPVLIIVPDVLGSVLKLKEGGAAVWLDAAGLSLHGFGVVADRAATAAMDLVGLTYQQLVEGFSATHEVIPFAWDWRDSMVRATAALEQSIGTIAGDRTIHLIGHGAGGLVIRRLSDAAWGRIKGRALLLATPENGMFPAAEWCSPRSRLVRMLALADGAMTADEIAASFRTFDAVLELLPVELLEAQTRAAAWKRAGIQKPPSDARLDQAAEFRKSMPPPRAEMIGIAGRAAETPVGYDALKNEVSLSSSGDGRVTTDSLHHGIQLWRVEAAHGDLPSHAGAFSAYAQLLNEGRTSLLSQPQNVIAGLTTKPFIEEPLLFPSLRELVSEALASRADRSAQEDYPLAVSVTHGDLRMARYPVAVGHHVGDSIVSAEAVLDCQLGRRLSQRFQMGLYPAAIGTSEVIRDAKASPPGAIIIGLGQVGGVTAEVIRRGVAAAALRYALAVAEDREPLQEAWRSAAFASVVIGTRGGSKLTTVESIGAIIRGALDANRTLRRQKLWDRVRIDAVEFVELYEQRAISNVYAARFAVADVASELETGERVDLVPLLRHTKSGQFRIPPEDWQTGWWQRMSITMEPPRPDKPDEKDRPFKYLVLTDRARVEASLQCNERGSTWNLIRSAIGTPRFDPEISGALFELLVPNDIKTSADNAPRVVLILDADTAQYPWEMLADATRSDRQPQSVRSGMIRQFVTGSFRSSPRYSEAKSAFVVGDTEIIGPVGKDKLTMPKLPGAQAEAQAVSLTLSGAGYEVTTLIRRDAMTIEKQLFARPYRILHLAGHGTYNAEKPQESGMLLGSDIYLTACQLQQMRVVPDLVFINCCFLGHIDVPPVGGEPHRLAASVAQELIGMGVKAIVAAGWAVDDAAGVTFASTFYDGMLNQRLEFGNAVREAREAVFRKHASTNTWAAYQCYGNPGFALGEQPEDGVLRDGSQFCARREYVDELRSLAAQANALGSGDEARTQKEKLAAAVRGLNSRVPADWNDGELLMRAGLACRALGDFEQAADFLEKALSHQSGRVSLEGVEQLGNMYSRLAIERHREGDDVKRDKYFERARELFDLLVRLAPSSERWSLLGSAQKKRAAVVKDQERQDLLAESAASYAQASGGTLVYPLLNQVAVVWVRDGQVSPELQAQFDAARGVVQGLRNSADFWERVGTPDYELTRRLLANDLDVEELKSEYLAVAQQSGTNGDKRSVVEQHEFLAEMLSDKPDRQALRDKLLELAKSLRKAWQIEGGK